MIPKKTPLLLASLFFLTFFVNSLNAVTFEYDDLNRLVRVTYEDGAVIEYTYDEVGNRLTLETTVPDPDEGDAPDILPPPPSPPRGIRSF
jgi:YD repeat-containing protein